MPNNPQSIAVLGASARSAAFSVLRSGRNVVAVDLFADADLAQHVHVKQISAYPEGFVDWLAASECDAWLYTGALENYPDLVDQLSQIRPLLGNQGDALRRCRDPLVLQDVLTENGLGFPATQDSGKNLPLDGSWLCKTYRGSSGSGVWQLDGNGSLDQAEAAAAYFQKRVEGWPIAVVFALGEQQNTTLGMTTQWVGADAVGAAQFQYAGSLELQQDLPNAIQQQIEKLAYVLAKQFHLRGLVGVDLLIEVDRLWVLEINPRYTASVEILERNSGISAIDAHVAACLGAQIAGKKSKASSDQAHGKAVLYAKQEVTIDAGFFAWAIAQSGYQLDSGLADVPVEGSLIPQGRPVLTVFAAASRAMLDAHLRQRIGEVEARLYS